jgi:galactokinase
VLRNLDHQHAPVDADLSDYRELMCSCGHDWLEFIATEQVSSLPPTWERYALGAILRAQWTGEVRPMMGVNAFVASDLPQGSALSSSAALCLALIRAVSALSGKTSSAREDILACRDAEWFTGARTGTSDPAAMILGGAGVMAHVALLAEDFSLDTLQRIPFPEDEIAVVVAESNTTRSLRGSALLGYVRNRAAYSIALEVFRQEMYGMGIAEPTVAFCDRLSRIDAAALGGIRYLAAVLSRVPESLELEALRQRYELPELDAVLARYFGALPMQDWPKEIPLRGPLVFGIAESHRAACFGEAVRQGDWVRAGHLMSRGHDGDRGISGPGEAFDRTVTARDIARLGDDSIKLEDLPGDYGASPPMLDTLVDAALGAGALGASLTGAGIAGSVIALCRRDDAPKVHDALRGLLCSEAYARIAGFEEALSPSAAEASVSINATVAPAGELPPPALFG